MQWTEPDHSLPACRAGKKRLAPKVRVDGNTPTSFQSFISPEIREVVAGDGCRSHGGIPDEGRLDLFPSPVGFAAAAELNLSSLFQPHSRSITPASSAGALI